MQCGGLINTRGTTRGHDETDWMQTPQLESPVGADSDPLFVNSLAKGFRVLYAFSGPEAALSLTEIAAATGLNMSAAQRFTHSLEVLGFLRKDPASRRYRPAPRLLDFAFMYQRSSGLAERAMPHLIALAEDCGESVQLVERDGAAVVYLARLPRQQVRVPSASIGARMPIHCTATGRAILARLPETEARGLIESADLRALTEATLTDVKSIMARVAEARRLGFALVVEECVAGEIAVAAPILDRAGRAFAALGVPVPRQRRSVATIERDLAPRIVETAQAIARGHGGGGTLDRA